MGFSHHRVTLRDAVEQGLAERINFVSGRRESRAQFLGRIHAECIDEEQWLQEYCCQPCDDSQAFITWEMITSCEHSACLKPFSYLTGEGEAPDELTSIPSPLLGERGRVRGPLGSLYAGEI